MPVSQFTCEDCGKSFTRQSNLHRHRRTTHHVDTISCSTCGRRFNRRDNYLRHTRNHIRIPDQESRPIVGSELLSDSQIQESIQKENVCPNFQNQVGSGVPLNDPQGKYLTFLVFLCISNCSHLFLNIWVICILNKKGNGLLFSQVFKYKIQAMIEKTASLQKKLFMGT